MSFNRKNIFGYKLSSLVGVAFGLSVGVVLFILVYLGKTTLEAITPIWMSAIPIVLAFLLHGPKGGGSNASGGVSPQ